MPHKFLIACTKCGNENSQVYVKCYIKTSQISLLTVIDTVDINRFNGDDIKKQWCLRFLVTFKLNSSFIFIVFLEEFIRIVLITDSVLFSIGAPELMKSQNKIDKHDLSQQEKQALVDLRKWMFSFNVIILENNDLFFDCISNNEPHLSMFSYNKEDEDEVRNADARTLEPLNKNLATETSYTSKSLSGMSISFSHDENLSP